MFALSKIGDVPNWNGGNVADRFDRRSTRTALMRPGQFQCVIATLEVVHYGLFLSLLFDSCRRRPSDKSLVDYATPLLARTWVPGCVCVGVNPDLQHSRWSLLVRLGSGLDTRCLSPRTSGRGLVTFVS